MINQEAFLYCWTDKITNKLYIGVHKGLDNDGYICSSNSFLKEYNIRPNDFSREIIARGTYKDVLSLETSILKTVDARRNKDYYNLSNNDGMVYREVQTPESNAKRSKAMMGKNKGPRPVEVINKMKETKVKNGSHAGANNSQYGVQKSYETCAKISNTRIVNGVAKGEKNPNFGKKSPSLSKYNESLRGAHWYTDGVKSKMFHEHQVPEGWVRGRKM
jgi:hypothetical protein